MEAFGSPGKLIIIKVKNLFVSLLLDSRGKAVQINVYNPEDVTVTGNIFIGRVEKFIPSLNAAFVELPRKEIAYMQLKPGGIAPMFVNPARKLPLKPGDKIVVQVNKESIKGKNISITTDISITGRYCIVTPRRTGLHFSGKFRDPKKKADISREYAQRYTDGESFIIRTNSVYTETSDIFKEADALLKAWKNIQNSIGEENYVREVYRAPSQVVQVIRDAYDSSFSELITDNETVYQEAQKYLSVYAPMVLKRLRFYENTQVSLRVSYDINKQLRQALDRLVWLKSGAYLYVEPTQALIAIDVNTGKHISNKNPEDEFLKINQEAAAEIARQIRIRNLSGIIIVDFINMKDAGHKKMLLEYLKTQLQFDPVKTNIIDMTKLDLVEITRSKIHKPIYELLDISMLQ